MARYLALTTLPIVAFVFLLMGCSGPSPARETSGAENASGVTSEAGGGNAAFIPGQVLAALPVFPGATGSMALSGFSQPVEFAYCDTSRCPGFQTASAQYRAAATGQAVVLWYEKELTAQGYRKSRESFGKFQGTSTYAASYFMPDQPTVAVEVHVLDYPLRPDFGPLFELFVTYQAPFYHLPSQIVPDDVERVELAYYPREDDKSILAKKVTEDSATLRRLIGRMNNLPVLADWVRFCGTGERDRPLAELRFVRRSGETIVVTQTRNFCPGPHVEVPGLPPLEDVHDLLWEVIQEIAGIDASTPPAFGGATPTPPGQV
ncbi:MAG: hypothetical protein HY681_14090 [Chloroflexi bacterium]|nr:hypothetical protein [Chloroflexota bacterium]